MFPPHVVAIACIYLAGLLSTFEQEPSPPEVPGCRTAREIAEILKTPGEWESTFRCHVEDLDGMYPPCRFIA